MQVALLTGWKSHEDIAPDAGAYWYWLHISMPKSSTAPKEKTLWIGPLRIGPDEKNIGNYVRQDDNYKLQASRNETLSKISWNIPEENLKYLTIKRDTKTIVGKRKIVFDEIRECAGHVNDALPDPHADYWYWMEILFENGAIITRGPVRAEYTED
jgi:hypothetical protein